MRAKAEQVLSPRLSALPDVQEVSGYGDRIEVRRVWAQEVTAESIGLYAATQVFVVERQVHPLSPTVAASTEKCYAISSVPYFPDPEANARELLNGFRGHWSVESKNHYRRDVTYQEDRSPVKNHNAARVLASMKMLAIFLCQIGAHAPLNDRERSLPEFNRSCAINGIDRAMNWMKRKHNPLAR
jgi:hypothetical protein